MDAHGTTSATTDLAYCGSSSAASTPPHSHSRTKRNRALGRCDPGTPRSRRRARQHLRVTTVLTAAATNDPYDVEYACGRILGQPTLRRPPTDTIGSLRWLADPVSAIRAVGQKRLRRQLTVPARTLPSNEQQSGASTCRFALRRSLGCAMGGDERRLLRSVPAAADTAQRYNRGWWGSTGGGAVVVTALTVVRRQPMPGRFPFTHATGLPETPVGRRPVPFTLRLER